MIDMDSLKRWWNGLFSKDRRRSDRQPAPQLAVYYWTGAAPAQHEVRDISPTGLYVVTDERWYPGTIVKMTLQRTDGTEETTEHIAVESKAVRWGEDGVGLSFVMLDNPASPTGTSAPTEVADRKAMEKFLSRFLKKPE
jgi:PilZ domain